MQMSSSTSSSIMFNTLLDLSFSFKFMICLFLAPQLWMMYLFYLKLHRERENKHTQMLNFCSYKQKEVYIEPQIIRKKMGKINKTCNVTFKNDVKNESSYSKYWVKVRVANFNAAWKFRRDCFKDILKDWK